MSNTLVLGLLQTCNDNESHTEFRSGAIITIFIVTLFIRSCMSKHVLGLTLKGLRLNDPLLQTKQNVENDT